MGKPNPVAELATQVSKLVVQVAVLSEQVKNKNQKFDEMTDTLYNREKGLVIKMDRISQKDKQKNVWMAIMAAPVIGLALEWLKKHIF